MYDLYDIVVFFLFGSRRALIYKGKTPFLECYMLGLGCITVLAPQTAFLSFVNQGVTRVGV